MKNITPELLAFLNNNRQAIIADLLTVTTIAGSTYRYTNADIDLTWNSNSFNSKDIIFQTGNVRIVVGVQVDTFELGVFARPENTIGGTAFFQALSSGQLDGAVILAQRAYMSSFTSPIVGVLTRFSGRLSDIEVGRTEARITCKSDIELLNVKMPRNLYQPGCVHTLFDSGCGLNKAAFGSNSSVQSSSTKTSIHSGLSQAAGFFDLGTITWTSGQNSGVSRNIKSFASGVITLNYPLVFTPQVGDTFTAYPGCDKLKATCQNKFSNLAQFRGFPYVPVAETAS